MDVGVVYDPVNHPGLAGVAVTTAIMEGSAAGAYDVIVGGAEVQEVGGMFSDTGGFDYAGAAHNYLPNFARWRVGYPQPTLPPTVTITSPTNTSVYPPSTQNVPITVVASSSYTTISEIDYYINGWLSNSITSLQSTNVTNTWTWPTANVTGWNVLTAVATDTNGLSGLSDGVIINFTAPNNTVTAGDDAYVFTDNSPPQVLNVLANVRSSIGGKLQVLEVDFLSGGVGTAQVSFDGSSIIYTMRTNYYGTDTFAYNVTDGHSTNWANIIIQVRAAPVVIFQNPNPTNPTTAGAASSIPVNGAAFIYDTTATNFSLFVNGNLWKQYVPANLNYDASPTNFWFNLPQAAVSPQSSYFFFTNTWSTNVPGFYTFQAFVQDTYGFKTASWTATVGVTNATGPGDVLTATISNLTATITTLGTTVYPVVTNGRFDSPGPGPGLEPDQPGHLPGAGLSGQPGHHPHRQCDPAAPGCQRLPRRQPNGQPGDCGFQHAPERHV